MLDIFLFTLNTIMPVLLLMTLGVGGSNGQRQSAAGQLVVWTTILSLITLFMIIFIVRALGLL